MSSILIHGGAVLTPDGWIEPGTVLVSGDKIAQVTLGEPSIDTVRQADIILDARNKAVLPGLTNAHTHLSQTFMRGLSAGRTLIPWLKEIIWPLERAMSVEELRLAATLGMIENLHCGVTQVVDHHKVITSPAHTDIVCEAAQKTGIRLVLARAWADQGSNAEKPDRILADLERLLEFWKSSGNSEARIQIANGPLTLWRCTPDTLQKSYALAMQYGSFTHLHVSETQQEVQEIIRDTGLRPIHWMESLGLLGPNLQVVHAVWIDESEIDLLIDKGVTVVHCPVSNAILGSGIAPVSTMLRRKLNVFLGTDGSASNDTQDIFESLKFAVSFARASSLDTGVITLIDALKMATRGRTLTPGLTADIIVVNLDHPRAIPIHDIYSALVFCTHGSDVETVIVGGKLLIKDKQLLHMDEQALHNECALVAEKLLERVGL